MVVVERFHMVVIDILLLWLIGAPTSLSAGVRKTPDGIDDSLSVEKVYVQPSELVVREKSGKPLLYHFITDYPHPHIPTGNYIKPWEVVASKPIRVKNIDGGNNRILKKNNILYLEKRNIAQYTQ